MSYGETRARRRRCRRLCSFQGTNYAAGKLRNGGGLVLRKSGGRHGSRDQTEEAVVPELRSKAEEERRGRTPIGKVLAEEARRDRNEAEGVEEEHRRSCCVEVVVRRRMDDRLRCRRRVGGCDGGGGGGVSGRREDPFSGCWFVEIGRAHV